MEEYESFLIVIDWRHWEQGGDPDLQTMCWSQKMAGEQGVSPAQTSPYGMVGEEKQI